MQVDINLIAPQYIICERPGKWRKMTGWPIPYNCMQYINSAINQYVTRAELTSVEIQFSRWFSLRLSATIQMGFLY